MSQAAHIASGTNYRDLAAHLRGRDNFFFGMSGALLLILLAGFFRTLYMRAFFDVSPIPFYLYVHGAIVSCWFIWFVSQTSLVAFRRTDIHRRMGLIGAVLGIAVVGAALMATIGLVPRLPEIGVDLGALSGGIWGPQSAIAFVSWVVSLNFAIVSGFVLFLSIAIIFRRRPDVHKRLMLLASMSLMSPPLARISFWPVFSWVDEIPFVTVTMLLLLVPLGLHDLLAIRRLHVVTVAGGIYFALIVLAPLFLSDVESVHTFVRGLE